MASSNFSVVIINKIFVFKTQPKSFDSFLFLFHHSNLLLSLQSFFGIYSRKIFKFSQTFLSSVVFKFGV